MYKNEQKFSEALCFYLTDKVFYQRIESGLVGRGIPDLYLRFKDRELWLELKNDTKNSIMDEQWIVDWRAGQQAWMFNYYKACGKCVYTVVSMIDGFIVIPMKKRFIKNIVKGGDVIEITTMPNLYILLKNLIKT